MTVDVVTGEIVPAPRALERDTFGILGDAVSLAEVICNTELVPPPLRGRPDGVVAVVLAGHELGLGPMQSLQTIDLIQGRPSLSPEGMRALILSHGHTLVVEATEEAATVSCRRREWSDDQWAAFTFSMADAKRAGLTEKENWKKYPRAMLTARATSEAARAVFADVIAGLSYTPEEIESSGDFVPIPPADVGPSTGGKVRGRGRRQPSEALDASPSQAPAASPIDEDARVDTVRALERRYKALPVKEQQAFNRWRQSKRYPKVTDASAEGLEVMAAELTVLEARAEEERDTYNQAPIRTDSAPVGSGLD